MPGTLCSHAAAGRCRAKRGELGLQGAGFRLEGADFGEGLFQREPEPDRHDLLGQGGAGPGQHVARPHRDHDPELPQMAPDGIDPGGAGLEIALA
jgi:hypothetical protein